MKTQFALGNVEKWELAGVAKWNLAAWVTRAMETNVALNILSQVHLEFVFGKHDSREKH